MSDEYKEALAKAQAELERLEDRRKILLTLVETLKVLAQEVLYELTPPPGYEPEGLTPEIRKILGLTTVHLTATQIRDSLMQRGFSDKDPKTLLISVHTVLTRIADDLDVIERNNKRAFKMKSAASNLYGGYFEKYLGTLAEQVKTNDKVLAAALQGVPSNKAIADALQQLCQQTGGEKKK